MSKKLLPAPFASIVGPCSTTIQIGRMSRHWKFSEHHQLEISQQDGSNEVPYYMFLFKSNQIKNDLICLIVYYGNDAYFFLSFFLSAALGINRNLKSVVI